MSRRWEVQVGKVPVPASAAVKLFVDTDYQADVDDLMAHGQMFGHVYAGEADIIGMVCASTCTFSPVAIERMNVWHGYPNIPVGGWKNVGNYVNPNGTKELKINSCESEGWTGYNAYVQAVATTYPGTLTTSTVPDSTDLYRSTLAAQPDNSVRLLVIGFHTALYDFLQSSANHNGDGLPSGIDLANAKLKDMVVGGAREGGSPNFNFSMAETRTQYVLDTCGAGRTVDKPFYVMPNENSEPGGSMTNMQVGSDATNQPAGQIVRFAMDSFIIDTANFQNGHFAWDLMCTLAAVRGPDYAWDWTEGTYTFPTGALRETWTPGAGGPHIRLINNRTPDPGWYIDTIDPLIFHPEVA